jgi:hypothetical protein
MQLSVHKDEGLWRMSGLAAAHLHLFRQAADDATLTDSPAERERLFPPPVENSAEEAEFAADWREFVADDLEMRFASDVGAVLADLDQARPDGAIGEVRLFALDLPLEHAQAWFSTLNQARLLMDCRFRLHDPANQAIIESGDPSDADAEATARNEQMLAAWFRYELYAAVQEWIVRNVL